MPEMSKNGFFSKFLVPPYTHISASDFVSAYLVIVVDVTFFRKQTETMSNFERHSRRIIFQGHKK